VRCRKRCAVLLWLCLSFGCAFSTFADGPDVGFLYDQFELTLGLGERTEAAGPFYYRQQEDTERIWALPPILSYSRDPGPDMLEFNLFYPVMSYIRYGQQYRWQFFQLLAFAGGPTQTETKRDRFTVFPIYFQQRSSDTNENYTAYGPFYGHLKKRLMRDEIFYVMFPFYSKTRKGDVVTDNYVYPFFHLRQGNKLEGWQFWPLYGQEHKGVTYKTNLFGDFELVGGHDKKFVLWPFFFDAHLGLGTKNPTRQQALLPAYTFTRSPLRDQTTILWPFFTVIDEREKGYREWQMPWPFIGFARGPGKTINRVWPFYSRASNTNLQSDAYLWPVYKYSRLHTPSIDRERTRILFFLYSGVTEKNLETGRERRRKDMWPLFIHRTDFNGNKRFQALALLEPILPANHNIEREYSPVWSLWRSEKNPRTGASSQSLLWNLYRREVKPDQKKTSAFFGLYQSRRDTEGRHLKLFFIPVSGK
jgi:hypothetical protein